MNPEIPLATLLECARRELKLRKRVYPQWVAREKISAAKASHEIACMAAIVELLDKMNGRLL